MPVGDRFVVSSFVVGDLLSPHAGFAGDPLHVVQSLK